MGCDIWIGHGPNGTDGHPCAAPTVERLVFVNEYIASHVHAEGALDVCAEHLAEHTRDALLTAR